MKARHAADKLDDMGRRGDSMLAHITPKEALLLKSMGGAGTTNPKTGLLEFYSEDGPGGTDVGAERTGDYNFGGLEGLGGLDAFAGYGGMLGGAQPAVEEPNGGFGTAATEMRGFTPGVDMQTRNLVGQMLDKFQGLSPQQQMSLGMTSPTVAGLGMLGNYLDRNFGIGWSGGSMGGQASAGNNFDGGNIPGDNLTSQPGGLLGPANPLPTQTPTPFAYNRPAFTPTFGRLRTANFTNPYSRRGGLLGS